MLGDRPPFQECLEIGQPVDEAVGVGLRQAPRDEAEQQDDHHRKEQEPFALPELERDELRDPALRRALQQLKQTEPHHHRKAREARELRE